MSNIYTQNTKIEASDNIKLFLKAWLESVDELNNGGKPKLPRTHIFGLCDTLYDWTIRSGMGSMKAYNLVEELKSLFISCCLDRTYPFGLYEYRGCNLHQDPNRLSWVNAAITDELSGWSLAVPLIYRYKEA